MTPLFMLLLLLTAIGPGLGWVKSTGRSIRKNFLVPSLVSLVFLLGVYGYLGAIGEITSLHEIFVPKVLEDFFRGHRLSDDIYYAEGLYPTGIFLFLCALIVSTVVAEFVRAMRGRMRVRSASGVEAFFSVATRDNRRYGGYVVHIGIAVLSLGIVASSMFRIHETATLEVGETTRVGDYYVTPLETNRSMDELNVAALSGLSSKTRSLDDIEPGRAYVLDELRSPRREGRGSSSRSARPPPETRAADLSELASQAEGRLRAPAGTTILSQAGGVDLRGEHRPRFRARHLPRVPPPG